MEQILKQILESIDKLNSRMDKLDNDIQDVKASQIRMEHDHGTKLAALYDGFIMRGEQSERIQRELNERLDSIQTDLSYVVGKVAQHDRNFVALNKIAR